MAARRVVMVNVKVLCNEGCVVCCNISKSIRCLGGVCLHEGRLHNKQY